MIFVVAALRTYLAGSYSLKIFLQRIGSAVSCFAVGTRQRFDRELDRQLTGCFLLISVVLINAYQSLIISYLLLPRFYPELDTLRLLNDSCCWDRDEMVQWYHFRKLDKCKGSFRFDYLTINHPKSVATAHRGFICTVVDQWERAAFDQRPPLALRTGLYRWSRQTANEVPLLAWVMGDPVITERVLILGHAFLAEGALYNGVKSGFGGRSSDRNQRSLQISTSVDMLSLVWSIYASGMIVAIVVFGGEKCYGIVKACRRKRKVVNGKR